MTPARVLITGGGGQLATALVESVPSGVEADAPGIERLDITDHGSIEAALDSFRPSVVVNAAAYTAVDRAEQEPEAAASVNATAVARLAESVGARGARLVQISTDYVFDGLSGRPYAPDAPTSPLSVYGTTKRDGERAALTAEGALVVRTAWLYAPRGANFMQTMLRLLAERDEITVVADQIGSPTAASGLAAAVWGLVAAEATGIHHWTDAGVASWYDFAIAIQEEAVAAGLAAVGRASIRPIPTRDYPTPARRPVASVLDKDLTWSVLGGAADHWRVALRRSIAALVTEQEHAGRPGG